MKLLFAPVPHNEAADMVRRLPAVTRAIYDELAPELRALAFVITGIDDATQLQAAKDIIASLPAGADFREAKAQLVALLPYTGIKAQRRAELLLRHWGNIAYGAAAWKHLDRQRDTFPWWQYGGSTSRRRRETHKALEGIILRHDDPFWDTHFPPWEPGCNCQHPIALMDADVEKIREEDKNLPPDQRRVLEGAILKKLHEQQTLVRGINDIYDMRTPAERGENWNGWSPDNLAKGLDIAKVQADLSPGVFGKLVNFLTAQKLPGGGNVWDWWKARQPQAGAAPAAPAPVPAAAAPAAAPAAPVPPAKVKPAKPAKPAKGSREAIAAAVYTGEKSIGTGINATFKLTNGETVLFKPAGAEANASLYRRDVPDGTQWKREIAASLIHDALGFKVLPVTGRVDHPSHGKGSAMLWQDGYSTAGEYMAANKLRESALWAAIPSARRAEWQLFDDLINHLDRHGYNYMVAPGPRGKVKLALIDHGLSLPAGTSDQSWGDNGKRFDGPLEGRPLTAASRKALSAFLSQEAALRPTLRRWLEPAALDLIFRRAAILLKRGTYGSVIF